MIPKHLQPLKHLHLRRYTIHIKHQTIESGHQLMDPAVYHLNKSLCSTIPKTMHFLNDIIPPNPLNHRSSNPPSSALPVLIKKLNPKLDKPAQDDLRDIDLALILT